jgi:hypothetical protein
MQNKIMPKKLQQLRWKGKGKEEDHAKDGEMMLERI